MSPSLLPGVKPQLLKSSLQGQQTRGSPTLLDIPPNPGVRVTAPHPTPHRAPQRQPHKEQKRMVTRPQIGGGALQQVAREQVAVSQAFTEGSPPILDPDPGLGTPPATTRAARALSQGPHGRARHPRSMHKLSTLRNAARSGVQTPQERQLGPLLWVKSTRELRSSCGWEVCDGWLKTEAVNAACGLPIGCDVRTEAALQGSPLPLRVRFV